MSTNDILDAIDNYVIPESDMNYLEDGWVYEEGKIFWWWGSIDLQQDFERVNEGKTDRMTLKAVRLLINKAN